ncbi:MAG TPA: hypothetical protein VGE74_31125 [Gemmata sp.]
MFVARSRGLLGRFLGFRAFGLGCFFRFRAFGLARAATDQHGEEQGRNPKRK